MFEQLIVVLTTIFWGAGNVATKKSIEVGGVPRAIVYTYAFVSLLLIIGFFALHPSFTIDYSLVPAYLAQIIIGAIAILCLYKALEDGQVSVLVPLSNAYVLLVILAGALLLNQPISPLKLIGALLIVGSAITLSFNNFREFKLAKGTVFLLITVLGWGYYYSFIGLFIPTLGPYMTTFVTEIGIGVVILIYYLAKKENLSLPSPEESKYFGFRGALEFFGALSYIYSVEGIGAALTSAIVASSPLVSTFLSYIFLKEKLDKYKYIAIVVMVIGLVIIFIS